MRTRPPINYRKFNAPRFLNKFHHGGEPLVREFFAAYLPTSPFATAGEIRIGDVIAFIERYLPATNPPAPAPATNPVTPTPAPADPTAPDAPAVVAEPFTREQIEQIHRLLFDAYDLGDLQGAFFLRKSLQTYRITGAPAHDLAPEHLSLIVLTRWPEVFMAAYDRLGMAKTDNFAFYTGPRAVALADPVRIAEVFQTELRRLKRTPKVVVRSFVEDHIVNFIFYHEKAARAPLVIRDDLQIAGLLHRPAQQDFISYDTTTGHLEIEVGNRPEQAPIRQAFARVALGDETFYETPQSTRLLDLDLLLTPDFTFPDDTIKLRYLQIVLEQTEQPTFEIRSQDVFRSLDLNRIRENLQLPPRPAPVPVAEPLTTPAEPVVTHLDDRCTRVRAAHLAIRVPHKTRAILVELTAPNKVSFPRSMHSAHVFTVLRQIGLLRA